MIKRIIILVVLVAFGGSGVFAQDLDISQEDADRSSYFSAREQVAESFARRLYEYEVDRNQSRGLMRWSIGGGIAALVIGSVAVTLSSAEMLNADVARYTTYGAQGLAAASGVGLVIGYRGWTENTDGYLETLRLQTQYYNVIDY